MWFETWGIITGIGVMLSFFIACQKDLPVTKYILAALIVPLPTLIAVVFDPTRQ
jgi:hypothetical protein